MTTSPVILLLTIGPKVTEKRILYFLFGGISAAFTGGLLFLIGINTRFPNLSEIVVKVIGVGFAGIVEEILRYPAILVTQLIIVKILANRVIDQSDNETITTERNITKFVDDDFTKIKDPHGMGLFFGFGWGFYETIAFYIYPRILLIAQQIPDYELSLEITEIFFRITGIIAHTALTYLAMAITINKIFWRITILCHFAVNTINVFFDILTPNTAADTVVASFTRFSLVLITYFLLRPRIRYQSPALLLYLLVALFLLVILVSTIIVLLVIMLTNNRLRIFG